MAGVSLRKLVKDYDGKFLAVKGIDLEIADAEFVVLVGRDSEAFRRAQAKYRDLSVQAQADEKPFDAYVEGVRLTAYAIKAWSLEDELNEKSAMDFLLNAPYVADQLDAALYDSKRFFS